MQNDDVLNVFDDRAQAYQDRFMSVDLYDATYDRFLELVAKPDAKVLEVGCGPGNISFALFHRSPALQLVGVDFSPKMIELARANLSAARFEVMDARHLAQLGERFDGIACGFVTPYLTPEEVQDLVRDCATLLHPGGVLYVSTIEGDPAQSGLHTTSDGKQSFELHYCTEHWLQQVFLSNGFTQIETMRVEMELADPRQRVHLVMMGRVDSLTL
jgi:ubiquinone/menaquinone biosynthesis C-methylase UbiE